MPEDSRHGWRVGALALAFAGVAAPTVAATPESVTIPLKVVTIPGVGVKVGIEVGLGGGAPRLYTFDTGSSGMYAAYNAAWWPTLQPLPGPTIPQSYGSGLQLTANPVSTLVTIPTDQGPISYTAEVGQITQASGTSDGEQWLANVAAGKPPLYGMFFGDFGSGLTKPAAGLFAVLPQLPGNLSSGFAVQLGCGGGSPESKVVVGLTTPIRSRVTSWVRMEKLEGGPPFPGSNYPTYKQAVFNGYFSLKRSGQDFAFTLPAILDTGGGTTDIHQQDKGTNTLVVPDAFLVQPGAADTPIVSGTQFRVTAPGTGGSNDFDLAFLTGTTATIDEVKASKAQDTGNKLAMPEVNLALIPFFRYDVVFDVQNGNVGFAPCTQATGATAPIPVLSAWTTALLAAALALFGAFAARGREARAPRRDRA